MGDRVRSPTCWSEVGESSLLGPDLVQETTRNVHIIKQRLETAKSRQKSVADTRRRPLEFKEGEFVFLKISPKRGVMRFGKKGKLSPRFIGPFQILHRVGEVAYKLALPPQLSSVHPNFHVSMLRKYLHDLSHIIAYDDFQVEEDVSYILKAVCILDRRIRYCEIALFP